MKPCAFEQRNWDYRCILKNIADVHILGVVQAKMQWTVMRVVEDAIFLDRRLAPLNPADIAEGFYD